MLPIETQVHSSIVEIPASEWDSLAGNESPFLEHAFLAALELSGSVSAKNGCVPRFVVAREQGRCVGAIPLYLKSHSYGEFIFDWDWAHAAHRAGIQYYPKLVCAVPFTPATGSRLLIANGVDTSEVSQALLLRAREVATEERVSSIHFLFCTEPESATLAQLGYAPRLSLQFHWENRQHNPYTTFEDYLSAFKSRHRKQIRKERLAAAAHGLTFRTAPGNELDERDWAALHSFYVNNVGRHQGIEYLRAEFFDIVRQTFAHRLVATLAYRGNEAVAGTINFEKGAHLYGRYWGCLEHFETLHFELCYYRLIERAIERGYTRFEAGAQGEHKLKRGLLPAFTHSAHLLLHPGLAAAVSQYIEREVAVVRARAAKYAEQSPFHCDAADSDL